MFHFISADFIFPISSPPIKNGVVAVDDEGKIEGVYSPDEFSSLASNQDLKPEKYSGAICPGFINAHCHLELSYLKEKIKAGQGLTGFISEVVQKRKATKEEIDNAIVSAENEMIDNGIVAVGDICNTTDTLMQKQKKRLRYHNFIELFDLYPGNADREFQKGMELYTQFRKISKNVSLSPHAPYTVSPRLLKLIHEHVYTRDGLLTIHNQETESENEMFLTGKGELHDLLLSLENSYKDWKPSGFNSLASTLVHLPKCNKTMLVHNTFSGSEDINWAHLYSSVITWCFCPNANLFIEKRVPDFNIFLNGSGNIVIGTDSYASNTTLSVLEELITISRMIPKIKLEIMLKWATWNGAIFFGWEKELGTLERGKRPGINLITGINSTTVSLTPASNVKPLAKFSV